MKSNHSANIIALITALFLATTTFIHANSRKKHFDTITYSDGLHMELLGETSSGFVFLDQLPIDFFGSNGFYNTEDAVKITNHHESLASIADGQLLAIDSRALPVRGDIIQLSLLNLNNRNYQFSIDLGTLPIGLDALLVDQSDDTETVLSEGMNTVDFLVDDSIAAHTDELRFIVKFQDSTLSTDTVAAQDFRVYPNPVRSGAVYISSTFLSSEAFVQIFDGNGRLISNRTLNTTSPILLSDRLSAGLYIVTIRDGKRSKSKKLVVQ